MGRVRRLRSPVICKASAGGGFFSQGNYCGSRFAWPVVNWMWLFAIAYCLKLSCVRSVKNIGNKKRQHGWRFAV
jgi:hypothetical protein